MMREADMVAVRRAEPVLTGLDLGDKVLSMRSIVAAAFFLLMTSSAWAGEATPFDPDQPFKQGFSTSILRSLLNQALDQLEDHLDITTQLAPDDASGDRRGQLRFKFYPEGKSKSDEHVSAEGSFHLAPDDTLKDFSFQFKNPQAPVKRTPLPSGDVL
jgi:hypothetical protein